MAPPFDSDATMLPLIHRPIHTTTVGKSTDTIAMELAAAPVPRRLPSTRHRANTKAVNRVHAQVAHVVEVVSTLPFIRGVLCENSAKTVRWGRDLAFKASVVPPQPDALAVGQVGCKLARVAVRHRAVV